ncbi:MAG: MaoC/PaaZ C-terminal domain-containing protein [Candidatus Hermodarchaeota archaeon]
MTDLDLSIIGKKTEEIIFEYDWKDVVLYALGIGAQINDLKFLYERYSEGLQVFPSFACIVAASGLQLKRLGKINFSHFVHGEQSIKLYQPFSPSGKIICQGEVNNIYDKSKAAVIHMTVSGHSIKKDHIFDTKWVFFYLKGGGFGGDPGPKTEPINPPDGVDPNFSISYKTSEIQAALYRLNGDYNPLHIDPEFAGRSGRFAGPILHGLCTYGYATRAIVYGACNGQVERLKEFKARFTHEVYPGEALTTEGWKDNNRYIIQVRTEDEIVLGNAYAIIK